MKVHYSNTYLPIIFISIIGAIVALVNWRIYGVGIIDDSIGYEKNAIILINGQFPKSRGLLYIGYIAFISLLKKRILIIFFQVMISILSATALFFTARKYVHSTLLTLIPSLFVLLWPKIQVWNYFILTESLFISFVCFSVCAMFWWRPTNWKVVLIILLTISIRPPGLIILFGYVGSLFVYLNSKYSLSLIKRISIATFILITLFISFNLVLNSFQIVETWETGKIVYNVHNYPVESIQNTLTLATDQLIVPSKNEGSLSNMINFILLNPLFSIKLFGLKIFYFIIDSRPYYSGFHITINILLLLFCYVFVIISFLKFPFQGYQRFFLISTLIGFMLMAGLTILSWEGRFYAPIYPILFFLSALGIDVGLRKLAWFVNK